MALIKCPECGKQISDKAKECIYCGYPIKEYLEKEIELHEESSSKQRPSNDESKINDTGEGNTTSSESSIPEDVAEIEDTETEDTITIGHFRKGTNNPVCPKCGKANIGSCNKCSNCGLPFVFDKEKSEKNHRSIIWIVLLLLIGIGCFCIYRFYPAYINKNPEKQINCLSFSYGLGKIKNGELDTNNPKYITTYDIKELKNAEEYVPYVIINNKSLIDIEDISLTYIIDGKTVDDINSPLVLEKKTSYEIYPEVKYSEKGKHTIKYKLNGIDIHDFSFTITDETRIKTPYTEEEIKKNFFFDEGYKTYYSNDKMVDSSLDSVFYLDDLRIGKEDLNLAVLFYVKNISKQTEYINEPKIMVDGISIDYDSFSINANQTVVFSISTEKNSNTSFFDIGIHTYKIYYGDVLAHKGEYTIREGLSERGAKTVNLLKSLDVQFFIGKYNDSTDKLTLCSSNDESNMNLNVAEKFVPVLQIKNENNSVEVNAECFVDDDKLTWENVTFKTEEKRYCYSASYTLPSENHTVKYYINGYLVGISDYYIKEVKSYEDFTYNEMLQIVIDEIKEEDKYGDDITEKEAEAALKKISEKYNTTPKDITIMYTIDDILREAYAAIATPKSNSNSSNSYAVIDRKDDDYWYAVTAAQNLVKEKLKSPSTAKFPTNDYTVKRSGRNFIVEGYVDAQNSFGAMLRTNWKATFTMGDTSGKEYKISNYNVTIYE